MKARLMNDFKEAMRNKDAIKKTVVAEIRAAIKLKEINESIELDDAQIITVIQKFRRIQPSLLRLLKRPVMKNKLLK